MSRFRKGVARPKKTVGRPPTTASNDGVEKSMTGLLDDLSTFEDMRRDLLPKLRKAVEGGASTKDILGTARAVAVARLASIAVLEADTKTALAAVKELLDRLEGRTVDKKEVTHAMAKLKDEELDALLITAVSESAEDSEDA